MSNELRPPSEGYPSFPQLPHDDSQDSSTQETLTHARETPISLVSSPVLHQTTTETPAPIAQGRARPFRIQGADLWFRLRRAIGGVLPFAMPTPEVQHTRAIAKAQRRGPQDRQNIEKAFIEDPCNATWQQQASVPALKQALIRACKAQFAMEGSTPDDMTHHEKWSRIKRSVENGDFWTHQTDLNAALQGEIGRAKQQQNPNPYEQLFIHFDGHVFQQCLDTAQNLRQEQLTAFTQEAFPTIGAEMSHSPVAEVSHSPVAEVSHSPVAEVSHSPVAEVSHSPVAAVSHSPVAAVSHYVTEDVPITAQLSANYARDNTSVLDPVGRAQTTELGTVDLGCTKGPSTFASGGSHCLDRVAISAGAGCVAVCCADGMGDNAYSERAAQDVTERLNQKLINHAVVLQDLYQYNQLDTIEQLIKHIFKEVQNDIIASTPEDIAVGGATAVAFIKIDRAVGNPLVIGASLGDCCATCTTIDSEGLPRVQVLSPSSFDPSIHSAPPGFQQARYMHNDSEFDSKTRVFIREVPQGTLLGSCSDGTIDNLVTMTPDIKEALGKFNRMDRSLAEHAPLLTRALGELVQMTFNCTLDEADREDPLITGARAALERLQHNPTTPQDNRIIADAIQNLQCRLSELSLQAIYSNPALDHLTPDAPFNFDLPRHQAIAQLTYSGAASSTPPALTNDVIARRTANFLHLVTAPVRAVQEPLYALQMAMRRTPEGSIALPPGEETRDLIARYQAGYERIRARIGDQQPELPFDQIIYGEEQTLLPGAILDYNSRSYEGTYGAKIDDVTEGRIVA